MVTVDVCPPIARRSRLGSDGTRAALAPDVERPVTRDGGERRGHGDGAADRVGKTGHRDVIGPADQHPSSYLARDLLRQRSAASPTRPRRRSEVQHGPIKSHWGSTRLMRSRYQRTRAARRTVGTSDGLQGSESTKRQLTGPQSQGRDRSQRDTNAIRNGPIVNIPPPQQGLRAHKQR